MGQDRQVDLTHLAWISDVFGGSDWLDALPRLIELVTTEWSLTLGPPFPDAHLSFAAPVQCADGSSAVLKIQYPHRECVHEAAALDAWSGRGAVSVFRVDRDRHALLLERCEPGHSLAHAANPLASLIGLVPRLWLAVDGPFDLLADEAARWCERLQDSTRNDGLDPRLADQAVGALRELVASQNESVLLHQDLHAGNVLAATREPWLAIDPKPLVGEREFSVAPIVRDAALGFSSVEVRRRLDRLCEAWDFDRDRARGWTIGQTMAWAEAPFIERHEQVVRWLLGEE